MGTIYFARLLPGERSVRIPQEGTVDVSRFTPEVGWLLIPEADADALCDVPSDGGDSRSPLAFEVCRMNLPEVGKGEEDSDVRWFARLNAVAMNEFGGCPLPGHVGWTIGAWGQVTRAEGHLLACLPSRLRDSTSAPAFDVRVVGMRELVEPLRGMPWPLGQARRSADASDASTIAAHAAPLRLPMATPSSNAHSARVCPPSAVARTRPTNLVLGVSVRDSQTVCRYR